MAYTRYSIYAVARKNPTHKININSLIVLFQLRCK